MRRILVGVLCLTSSLLVAQTARYRNHGPATLNDLNATPGDTVRVSLKKLCAPGYTATVRNVSAATKKQACEAYGVRPEHCKGTEVEIDHLISLELGGSNDLGNLWPEPYAPKPGAREKDRLENWLHKQVCDGEMSLKDAQQVIAQDWYGAYLRMLNAVTPPNTLLAATPSTGPSAETAVTAPPPEGGPEGEAFDFAISPQFLQQLEAGHSIQPTLAMKLGEHSGVHNLQSDCELHVAGETQGAALGWPPAFVVEPPNICKNSPSTVGAGGSDWLGVFDGVIGSDCQVTGFPRIFTEHASGAAGASNPNHVFEVHPATNITCGQQPLTFGPLLKVFEGMRNIAPSTTASCIAERKLFVRFDPARQDYVFREEGGRCGNFAIVEVQNLMTNTIRSVGGGHSAIARISPDGQSVTTLKLYTLAPSQSDNWLNQGGSSTEPRLLLHGLFTYDYFAIVRTLHPQGQDWGKPQEWVPVRYPLALVTFGETTTVPWEE